MIPICLLLGYLIGELLSRYYHPKSKAHKSVFALFVPLCVGILIDYILAYSKHPDDISFSYVLGLYMPFTILPAIVTMITLFVRLKVNQEEDKQEEIINEDNHNSEIDTKVQEAERDTIIDSSDEVQSDSIINKKEEEIQEQQRTSNVESKEVIDTKQIDKPEDSNLVLHPKNTVIQIGEGVQHIVKITSNVECEVYLDCEKIGSVADGKMIKIAINDGPYLLRCVSIYNEVIEHSFELSKDELFNFKFSVQNEEKPKKKWF